MDISLFLAKVIGLYLLIVGIGMALRGKQLMEMVEEFSRNPGLIMIAGAFTLVLGLLMVVSHNVWEKNWTLLITLFSWLTLIAGILRFNFPKAMARWAQKFKGGSLLIISLIWILLGAFLTYRGIAW